MSKGNPIINNMRGKLGAYVFAVNKGQMIQRSYRGSGEISNPRSEGQMRQRVQIANIVSLYRVSRPLFAKAFENKPTNYSDYNMFVSLNLNKEVKVYLTKDQAAGGTCVVAPYLITKGSLTPIEVTALEAGGFVTNLRLGSLSISDSTTVAQFSQALIAANNFVYEGMQLTYASFVQQTNNETNLPYCSTRLYEVTLNTTNQNPVWDYIPEFGLSTVNGAVGTGDTLAAGGFAYILSSKDSTGKLRVSTQRIVMSDDTLYDQYNDEAAATRSDSSYGYSDSVFLDPGATSESGSGGGISVGTTVNAVSVDGSSIANGADAVTVSTGDEIVLSGNGLEGATVTLYIRQNLSTSESSVQATAGSSSQRSCTVTVPAAANGMYLTGVAVNGMRYTTYNIQDDTLG